MDLTDEPTGYYEENTNYENLAALQNVSMNSRGEETASTMTRHNPLTIPLSSP
jgi:hypothetical protein